MKFGGVKKLTLTSLLAIGVYMPAMASTTGFINSSSLEAEKEKIPSDVILKELSQTRNPNLRKVLLKEYKANLPFKVDRLTIGRGIIPALANSVVPNGSYGFSGQVPLQNPTLSITANMTGDSESSTKSMSDTFGVSAGFGPFSVSNSTSFGNTLSSSSKSYNYVINGVYHGLKEVSYNKNYYDNSSLKSDLQHYMSLTNQQDIINYAYTLISNYGFGMIKSVASGIMVNGIVHFSFESSSDRKTFSDKVKASYSSIASLSNNYKHALTKTQNGVTVSLEVHQLGGEPGKLSTAGFQSTSHANSNSASGYSNFNTDVSNLQNYLNSVVSQDTSNSYNFGIVGKTSASDSAPDILSLPTIVATYGAVSSLDQHYLVLQEIIDNVNNFARLQATQNNLNKIANDLAQMNTRESLDDWEDYLRNQYQNVYDWDLHVDTFVNVLQDENNWVTNTSNQFVSDVQNLASNVAKQNNLTVESLQQAYQNLIDSTLQKIEQHKQTDTYKRAQALLTTEGFSFTVPSPSSSTVYLHSAANMNNSLTFTLQNDTSYDMSIVGDNINSVVPAGDNYKYISLPGFNKAATNHQLWGEFVTFTDAWGITLIQPVFAVSTQPDSGCTYGKIYFTSKIPYYDYSHQDATKVTSYNFNTWMRAYFEPQGVEYPDNPLVIVYPKHADDE
ncbi:hypothetical protein [Facilibium subflavum]|uniref:hypothetical protein n=1 Tax=Facilibium subflavum TaxID=2219058 RepID=UPI000E652A5F|nr:hypothetical protein [Facilibium subflavum]